MGVHLLGNELGRWDAAAAARMTAQNGQDHTDHTNGANGESSLLLTFFADERPLRGAAGLADWRLCGRLSNLIHKHRIRGNHGETLMLPPGRRLPFTRLVLFGLGQSQRFDERAFREHVHWIREVASRARLRRYALQPPGRATGLIGARRALELWLEEADKDGHEADVSIIDNQSGQKDMAEILRYQRSRRKKK